MTPEQKAAATRLDALVQLNIEFSATRISRRDLGDIRTVLEALATSQPAPAADTGQTVAKARAAVERLANTPMNLSLEDWCVLSADILKGLDAARPAPLDAERVRGIAVEAASKFISPSDGDHPELVGIIEDALRQKEGK